MPLLCVPPCVCVHLSSLLHNNSHAYGNGVEQQQQQLVDTPVYDSLGGSLAPTESVPVGRINHEHVIPFSELTLKELIGSGAEGKVGLWLGRLFGVFLCVGCGW